MSLIEINKNPGQRDLGAGHATRFRDLPDLVDDALVRLFGRRVERLAELV